MNDFLVALYYLVSILIIHSSIEKRLYNNNTYVETKITTDQTIIIRKHDINTENLLVLLEIFKNAINPRRAGHCVEGFEKYS